MQTPPHFLGEPHTSQACNSSARRKPWPTSFTRYFARPQHLSVSFPRLFPASLCLRNLPSAPLSTLLSILFNTTQGTETSLSPSLLIWMYTSVPCPCIDITCRSPPNARACILLRGSPCANPAITGPAEVGVCSCCSFSEVLPAVVKVYVQRRCSQQSVSNARHHWASRIECVHHCDFLSLCTYKSTCAVQSISLSKTCCQHSCRI